MKICNECKIEKELTEFYKNNQVKCGYNGRCKECVNAYHKSTPALAKARIKRYRNKHRDIVLEKQKEYYHSNKAKFEKYREKNKEKLYAYNTEYSKRPEVIERRKKRYNDRYANDPLFHATRVARCAVISGFRRALNGKVAKSKKTQQILGCTFPEFMKHIESLFQEGMSWDNHGEWHLDHIVPISTAKTEEDIFRLSHHSNFQPLWAEDNLKKSNKIVE